MLLLRFEELRREPQRAVAAVLDFLGARVDAQRIQAAVQATSLARMKRKEDQARETVFRDARQDLRFIGQGQPGGWQARLEAEDLARIQLVMGASLERAGYAVERA